MFLDDISRNLTREVIQMTRIQGVNFFFLHNSRVSKKFYIEQNINIQYDSKGGQLSSHYVNITADFGVLELLLLKTLYFIFKWHPPPPLPRNYIFSLL